jgi:hypothetical protein
MSITRPCVNIILNAIIWTDVLSVIQPFEQTNDKQVITWNADQLQFCHQQLSILVIANFNHISFHPFILII